MGQQEECSEAAMWERYEGGEVARWERWESSKVTRWEVSGFIQEWGTQADSKISSFCF